MTTDPRITVAQDLTAMGPQAREVARQRPWRAKVGPNTSAVISSRQIGGERIEGGK